MIELKDRDKVIDIMIAIIDQTLLTTLDDLLTSELVDDRYHALYKAFTYLDRALNLLDNTRF